MMLLKKLAGGPDDHGSCDVAFDGARVPRAPRTCDLWPPFPLVPLPFPPVNSQRIIKELQSSSLNPIPPFFSLSFTFFFHYFNWFETLFFFFFSPFKGYISEHNTNFVNVIDNKMVMKMTRKSCDD